MIELTAEHGYDAVTIRGLTQRAGVSSRSFYTHFAGKEDCFLEAHRWIAQKGLCEPSESQAATHIVLDGVERAVTRLAHDWGAALQETHVLLLSPYQAGDRSRDQLRHAECLFRARMERCVAEAGFRPAASTLIASAIIDGLISVAQSWLSNGVQDLARQANDLSEWACAYMTPSMARLASQESDHYSGDNECIVSVVQPSYRAQNEQATKKDSDLALLLLGATKLASRNQGTRTFTPHAIAAAAGVSRKRFFANFRDAGSCLSAALILKIAEVMYRVRLEAQSDDTPTMRLLGAVNALCRQLLWEPSLSDAYLGDTFAGMASARLQVQSFFATELRALLVEAAPDITFRSTATEASIGALWGALRHHRASHGAAEARFINYYTYLILAPAVGASSMFDAMQQEGETSAA